MESKSTTVRILAATVDILRAARPPVHLAPAAAGFSVLASLFQLFSLGLIVPVLNGLVDPNHYEALLNTHTPFGRLLQFLPFEFDDNKSIFLFIVSLVLVCVYLENFFLYLGQAFSAKLATATAHHLRVAAFKRFLGFGKAFYDRRNLGQLNIVLTTLITGVSQHIHHISMLFVTLAFCGAFLALMLAISWRLSLLVFVLLPLTQFASRRLTKKLKASARGEVDHRIKLSEHSLDVLKNMMLTQLSGQEKRELVNFQHTSEQIREHGTATRCKRFAIPRLVDVINSTGIIILACGAAFIFFRVETTSIGRLTAFFIALRRFTSHVELLVGYWSQCISNFPTLEEVLWVFDEHDKPQIESGRRPFPGVQKEIRFDRVSFGYSENQATLSDISFSAKRGTMTAIVGPTGAGKTTLVNLLPRFYNYQSGTISIDGTPITDFDLHSLRRKLAVVSQHSMIFHATIRQNITYGLEDDEWTEEELVEACRQANIIEFIHALPAQFETYLGKNGVQLSGGEQQRLSIARALLRNPDILILDEATSALDAETELAVQSAIDHLIDRRTVFVIAHRFSTIRAAEQILVLDDGRIVEHGTSQELLALEGRFHRYCELQSMFY